jgi:type II secretory pathway component GspD/PulD (secretin)
MRLARTIGRALRRAGLGLLLTCGTASADPLHLEGGQGRPVTLVVRDSPLSEVYQMISRSEGVNILLGRGVTGSVSVNLFEVSLDRAIRSIAESAGYVAEHRRGTWMILPREDAGQDSAQGNTVVQTFRLQYSDPTAVAEILRKYLSRYGDVTVLAPRRLLIVEDLPEFIARMDGLLDELDREPQQILIEARILEITLTENDTYGIDWRRILEVDDGTLTVGVRGLTSPTLSGLFANLVTSDIEAALNALTERGRVRTLSTPTLLAVEDEPADVVIGDRLGFRVTTTINQVTTESIEFLESGVILRFTASVDRGGNVVLEVHPEVSTGTIDDGLPSQRTTEVTTKLVTEDGQKVFIGGLLRDSTTQNRSGVPYLMDIPWLGVLFRKTTNVDVSTETVVILTAHVMGSELRRISDEKFEKVHDRGRALDEHRQEMEEPFGGPDAPADVESEESQP